MILIRTGKATANYIPFFPADDDDDDDDDDAGGGGGDDDDDDLSSGPKCMPNQFIYLRTRINTSTSYVATFRFLLFLIPGVSDFEEGNN